MDHGDFRLSPKLARLRRIFLLNQRRLPPRRPTFERTIPVDPNLKPLLPHKRSSATVEQSPSSSQAIDRPNNSNLMAKHFGASDSPMLALSIRGFRKTQSKTTSYSQRNPLSNLTNVYDNQHVSFNPTVLTMNNSSGNYTGNDMKENASPGQDYSNISGINGGPSATLARGRHGAMDHKESRRNNERNLAFCTRVVDNQKSAFSFNEQSSSDTHPVNPTGHGPMPDFEG